MHRTVTETMTIKSASNNRRILIIATLYYMAVLKKHKNLKTENYTTFQLSVNKLQDPAHVFTPVKTLTNLEFRLVLEGEGKLDPSINKAMKVKFSFFFFFFFVESKAKETSTFLLEQPHWQTLGELVIFSPRQAQPACHGLSLPSIAEPLPFSYL